MVVDLGYLRRLRINSELDTSPELDPDAVSYHLTIIDIIRWIIKLGRIDIMIKVPLLSSLVALSREGHLDAAEHASFHVGQRYNSKLVYDPSYPEIDHSVFKKCDWSEFHRDSKVDIPANIPEPQVKDVDIFL